MREAGGAWWQIDVRRGDPLCDVALWIRAAERLDVPADLIVPGPLEIDQLPSPTADPPIGLGAAWLEWWRTLLPVSAETAWMYSPPDYPGLSRWPDLREVVVRRWNEAVEWHRSRIQMRRRAEPDRGREIVVVREVERLLGREVAPFDLRFVLLPVRESTVRQVAGDLFLVPERLYDGPEWPGWLRDLVRRIG